MKTVHTITVKITLPWWANPYLRMCAVFAQLHGLEMDPDKVASFIAKHSRMEIV